MVARVIAHPVAPVSLSTLVLGPSARLRNIYAVLWADDKVDTTTHSTFGWTDFGIFLGIATERL